MRVRLPLTATSKNNLSALNEAVRILNESGSICWQVGNHVDRGEVYPLDMILYQQFKNHSH